MSLRPYQAEAVNTLWNALFSEPTALCVMPCGTGKTQIFTAILERALQSKADLRAVVLVDKVELLKQTERRLSLELGEGFCGVYCGSAGIYDTHYPITIASIQSIFDVDLDAINLLIIDECHRVNQADGRYKTFLDTLALKNGKLKTIGFSATPYRPTGHIYGKESLFPRVTFSRSLCQMMDLGYLVPPRLKRVDQQFDLSGLRIRAGEFASEDVDKLVGDEGKVRGQIWDALPRMAGRRKAVFATSSIAHCEMVFRLLQEAGEKACKVHSKMSQEDRDDHLYQRFVHGDARHLVFVSIVSEGFDYPPIDTVVLMSPIRSPVRYIQTVGRGLRPSESKLDCLVLDYGRVVETVGPLDDPRVPKSGERKGQHQEILMKFCPQCLEYQPVANTVCCCCDADLVQERKKTKNLTEQASERGTLLKEPPKPMTVELRSVSLSRYMSKNGNICLRVTYFPKNILAQPIQEYFTWGNSWAKERGLSRLSELGVCSWQGATLDELVSRPARCPIQVTTLTRGKYPDIICLTHARETIGELDPGLSEPVRDSRVEAT